MSDPEKSLSRSLSVSAPSPLSWDTSPIGEIGGLADPMSSTHNDLLLHGVSNEHNAQLQNHNQDFGGPMSISSPQPFLDFGPVFEDAHFRMEFDPKNNENS